MPSVSISVVITNYNYGHFLDSCIGSVLAQTYAASEIIVVDDGSTDFSLDLLNSYTGIENVKVVSQNNKGQTAAINNGFDHATGDVVIFLDSDDRLKPNALETVALIWSDRFSMVSYGLSLIDELGQRSGSYVISHNPRSGYNLNFLLSRGFVPHYPTSGNAFKREAISRFFPFPEDEWTISTDALLVRAAICAGQVRYVKQELGEYRIHRANNYFIDGLASTRVEERAFDQMAKASEFLAFDAGQALGSGETNSPRPSEFVFLSTRLVFEKAQSTGDYTETSSECRRLMRRNFSSSATLSEKLITTLILLPLSVTGGINRLLSRFVFPKYARPLWLSRVIRTVQSKRFLNRRNEFFFGQDHALLSDYTSAQEANFSNYLCPTDWSYDYGVRGYYNTTKRCSVRFRLNSFFDAARLSFTFSVNPCFKDRKVSVTITEDGTELVRSEISGDSTVSFTLPSSEIVDRSDRIFVIEAETKNGTFIDAIRPSGVVALTSLDVNSSRLDKTGAVIPLNRTVAFKDVASSMIRTDNLLYDKEGNPIIKGDFCSLIVRPATISGNSILFLYFSKYQRRTELLVRCGDRVVFTGAATKNGVVKIELPNSRWFDPINLAMEISDIDDRDAHDGIDEVGFDQLNTLRIVSVGICAKEPVFPGLLQSYSYPENFLPLSIGTRIYGNNNVDFKRFFDDRWILDSEFGARLKDLEGSIRFRQNPTETGTRLVRISALPTTNIPDDSRLILVIQINGTLVDQVEVAGRAMIDLPLPEPSDSVKISIDLHAGFVRRQNATEPYPSGIVIESVELIRFEETDIQTTDDQFRVGLLDDSEFAEWRFISNSEVTSSVFHKIVSSYYHLKKSNFDISETTKLRELVSKFVNQCSQESIANIATSKRNIGLFVDVCNDLNQFQNEVELVVKMPEGDFEAHNSIEQIRYILTLIASGPAYQNFDINILDHLSPLILSEEFAFEKYILSQSLEIKEAHNREQLFDYYCSIAKFCHKNLRNNLVDDPLYKFAFRVLQGLQGSKLLLFNNRNMSEFTEHFGQALAVALLRNEHGVSTPPIDANADSRSFPCSRIRIGVLVYDLNDKPETDLLFGMFRGLDKNIFDITIFSINSGDRSNEADLIFDTIHTIGEMHFDDAISFIQQVDFEFFFLGSFSLGYNNINLMFCHRLGRIQVATSAVNPSTTGLRSCDVFLTSRLCEPELVDQHYTEAVEVWESPVQCFSFQEERASKFSDPDHNSAIARRRYGIPLGATVFVSGAVTEKIVDELIGAWSEILARSKNTVLVLYPYAKNWLFSFDKICFENYVEDALKKSGLRSDRVVILSNLTRDDVVTVLRSSDIYLDSFPYSGATTVVEAIKCGLPVVALAGQTQRGLQGAGWLKAYGIDGNVSEDSARYIEAAVTLAADRKRLAQYKDEVRSAVTKFSHLNNSEVFGHQFGEWLLGSAKNRLGYDYRQQKTTSDNQTYHYVFHHMPKAGGTSCIDLFKSKFNIVYDYHRKPFAVDTLPPPVDLGTLTEKDLLCGHYYGFNETPLEERYPQIVEDRTKFRLITFVRDPLEHAISNCFYMNEYRDGFDMEFSEYIEIDPEYMLKFFNATEKDWKQKLEQYWFIGTLERLDECLHYLAPHMDLDIDSVPHLNVSTWPKKIENSDVTRFAKINRVSYDIYRHINSELDRRLSKSIGKKHG